MTDFQGVPPLNNFAFGEIAAKRHLTGFSKNITSLFFGK